MHIHGIKKFELWLIFEESLLSVCALSYLNVAATASCRWPTGIPFAVTKSNSSSLSRFLTSIQKIVLGKLLTNFAVHVEVRRLSTLNFLMESWKALESIGRPWNWRPSSWLADHQWQSRRHSPPIFCLTCPLSLITSPCQPPITPVPLSYSPQNLHLHVIALPSPFSAPYLAELMTDCQQCDDSPARICTN